MGTVDCVRCHRSLPALEQAPCPGEIGEEVLRKVCRGCWNEWQQAEVMVINELRLDFMDPRSNDTLNQHMREFLCLGVESAPTE